ncbi:hypothetical protein SAMN04488587_1911 [Methanococcoides vulcani]|uniref:Uncharacterized protein n=1 Tax=Methanococcoides vulcani TaxID=1353158 RepID=A0A1I0B2A9_9EURY|nr:hypothetical protein [Methanococcoides vulcani]SET00803.1 hypothetical protein SAMN04488587_1911 [Methanococcoides vulcani]
MTDSNENSEIVQQSKQLEEFKVDLNYNEEMGQIIIWLPVGGHDMRIITSSEDGIRDCVFVHMHPSPEKAQEAYEKFGTAHDIRNMFCISGIGKKCK